MKKSILLISSVLMVVGVTAQTNRKNFSGKLYSKVNPTPVKGLGQTAGTQRLVKPSVNGVQTSTTFAEARNGYGTLNEDNNTVHYNQDLNMIAFINRIPTSTVWDVTGLPTTGVSGFMVMHYSTDNGATWNGVCFANNGTDFSRHPSGVIANAPGNTNPALAKFVGVGPALTGGADFTSSWFASVPANSTGNVTTNDQQTVNSVRGSGTLADGASVYNNGLVANGTTVWAAARKESVGGFVNRGVAVFKGTTSGGAYTWTQDSVSFGDYKTSASGTFFCTLPKIAFSPDGMTGYVLVNGILSNAAGNNSKSIQPNLWKSTDAGATWAPVNQNYDWKASHPEILCNLIPTRFDSAWNGANNDVFPAFFDAHGSGMTVDNAGNLHYVTTVVPAYSTHPDSAMFIYTQYGFSYTQFDDLDKPWIYDFTTNGNGSWDQKIVGKLYTRNLESDDLVPDPAVWTMDGTGAMDYSNRIRVARSTNGAKVFYSWTDGDTTNVVSGVYHANTFPNIEYRGLDVASGLFSAQKEMSAFDATEDGYYNYYSSTIAMPTATGFRIPTVYISSQDGAKNLTSPVDFNYITDLSIDNTEYTIGLTANIPAINPAFCNVTIGLKDLAGSVISGVSQNYPNPTNATSTVKVNLNQAEVITLSVTNSIGQVVSSQVMKGYAGENQLTIDAANLTNGIYFYTVIAGNSKVTRKMSVVK